MGTIKDFYIIYKGMDFVIEFSYEIDSENDSYSDEFGIVSYPSYGSISDVLIFKATDEEGEEIHNNGILKSIKKLLLSEYHDKIIEIYEKEKAESHDW